MFVGSAVFAQNKQASIWFVGDKKLDFNTNPVTVTDVVSPFLGVDGSLALADKNGNLMLFASSTSRCLYNKNFHPLTNGDNISITGLAKVSIFIPFPNNDTLVYFINSNKYSIIDTKNNNVIDKNIEFNSRKPYAHNISAINHANCNDTWLLYSTNQDISFYLIDKDTISLKKKVI